MPFEHFLLVQRTTVLPGLFLSVLRLLEYGRRESLAMKNVALGAKLALKPPTGTGLHKACYISLHLGLLHKLPMTQFPCL